MRFSCDSCGAQYMISDEKVGPSGVRVRCKKCGNIVSVKRAPAVAPEIASAPPAAAPATRPEPGAETTLERELGNAFQSAFGGGSAGLADEERTSEGTVDAPAPAAGAAAPPAEAASAGAETASEWYVAINDRQVGPLPAPDVKARWESGEIGPDTLAWRPGMADWLSLSSIPEMAQYLAPVKRGGAAPVAAAAPAAEPRAETPKPDLAAMAAVEAPRAALSANGAANGKANGHDVTWKPSAASALAALASEEIASRQKPEPKQAEPAPEKGGSLLDRMELPEGGVDPTNVLPLPIKGLEPTGESALPVKRAPAAPEHTEIRRIKKSATRTVVAIGIGMAVLFAGGIAAVVWMLRPTQETRVLAKAPPAAVPVLPAPAPPPVTSAEPSPAPAPSAPADAPPSSQVAAGSPPPQVPPPAPAASAPPPAPEPARAAAPEPAERPVASRAQRKAKAAEPPPPAPRATRKSAQRVAAAERPPPAPVEQPRRKGGGDPLLDVGGDDEIEKELAGKGPKRSVYVPPAIGSDLPDSVSVSQINEAVVGQKSALVRCIEQQKAADPDTRGTLRMRWIIAGDGSVRDVRVVSDEFARQPIAPCITSIVRGIRFPRSRTTGQEVVFPFKF